MLRTFLFSLIMLIAAPAAAQDARVAADFVGGYAGFLDESLIGHAIVGATARYQLTRRVSVGPELVYMIGPGHDRDLFLTGNLIFDFLVPAAGSRSGNVNPYVVVGGGLMRHSNSFGGVPFSSFEGAWTGGAGARVWLSERAYALGEYRVGWEPHIRISGGIGMVW